MEALDEHDQVANSKWVHLEKIYKIMRAFILFNLTLATSALAGTSNGDFVEDLGSNSIAYDSNADESDGGTQLSVTDFTLDADLLISDDINVQRYSATLGLEYGDTTLDLSYNQVNYDLDVAGEAINPTNRDDRTDLYSLTLGQKWNDRVSSSLALSGYEGFTSHRSIWITETFDQTSRGAPGFQEADPSGFSVGLTNTFTLPNDFDTISWSIGYSRDQIAPGQTISFDPLTGFFGVLPTDDVLETFSTSLTGNFYVTNKVTSQLFLRASQVTDREVRGQVRLNTAWSITQGLTLRGEIGTTFESPDFDSLYGGLTLTYQLLDSLSATVGYRLYSDSGEITTSNFNSSAPEFDSSEISASLLWNSGPHSASLSAAFLETDLGDINPASARFEGLFTDRNFFAVRAAYTLKF